MSAAAMVAPSPHRDVATRPAGAAVGVGDSHPELVEMGEGLLPPLGVDDDIDPVRLVARGVHDHLTVGGAVVAAGELEASLRWYSGGTDESWYWYVMRATDPSGAADSWSPPPQPTRARAGRTVVRRSATA